MLPFITAKLHSGLGTGFGFLLTTGWRQREVFVSGLTSSKMFNVLVRNVLSKSNFYLIYKVINGETL